MEFDTEDQVLLCFVLLLSRWFSYSGPVIKQEVLGSGGVRLS